MSSNVIHLPLDDILELEEGQSLKSIEPKVGDFIQMTNDWCQAQGVDIFTAEYRHQVAVIMAQMQVILLGDTWNTNKSSQ